MYGRRSAPANLILVILRNFMDLLCRNHVASPSLPSEDRRG